MDFTRPLITVIFGSVLVLGCHRAPTIVDNSTLVAQPGCGISNICQIGMTFAQIKNATQDASTHGIFDNSLSWNRLKHWGRGRFVLVPSLGAIAAIGENQPIALVEFYVQPHKEKLIPGLEVREPFRGKLGQNLSFKDGPVSKLQVETVYGKINQVASNGAEALEYRRKGERFTCRYGGGTEELWYPDKGVAFVLTSNVVTSFQIYRTTGP